MRVRLKPDTTYERQRQPWWPQSHRISAIDPACWQCAEQ